MLTKSDFSLLFYIYAHGGNTTFKQQSIFLNKISFYRSIQTLKENNFIIVSEMKLPKEADNRICIYEITGKGIELCKLLL